MAAINSAVTQWQNLGHYAHVRGYRFFVIEQNPTGRDTLVLLHGFPTCSYDFYKVLPDLGQHFRVVAHDHLGFGLSEKPANHAYSIAEQADCAVALWLSKGLTAVHVLAHDYGVSVAAELMWRSNAGTLPIKVLSFSLCNSGVFYDLAKLRLTQHLLRISWLRPLSSRLTSKTVFQLGLRQVFARPHDVDQVELDTLWAMVKTHNGHRALAYISEYLEERRVYNKARWNQAIANCPLPCLILWGDKDPVGTMQIAHKLHAMLVNSTLHVLAGVGHYPMLEAPQHVSQPVVSFIQSLNA